MSDSDELVFVPVNGSEVLDAPSRESKPLHSRQFGFETGEPGSSRSSQLDSSSISLDLEFSKIADESPVTKRAADSLRSKSRASNSLSKSQEPKRRKSSQLKSADFQASNPESHSANATASRPTALQKVMSGDSSAGTSASLRKKSTGKRPPLLGPRDSDVPLKSKPTVEKTADGAKKLQPPPALATNPSLNLDFSSKDIAKREVDSVEAKEDCRSSVEERRPSLPPPAPPSFHALDEEEEELLNDVLPLATPKKKQEKLSLVQDAHDEVRATEGEKVDTGTFSALNRESLGVPPRPALSNKGLEGGSQLEELIAKAQQRLREKERFDKEVERTSGKIASANSRSASPMAHIADTSASRRADRPTFPYANNVAVDLTTREGRLQKENQRLNEEIAFLNRELQKLRSAHEGGTVATAEASKLQIQNDLLRQQLRDMELETLRFKQHFEEQHSDLHQHIKELEEQLEAYSTATAHYEEMCRGKDSQIEHEAAEIARLKTELHEKSQELARSREDLLRQREEDQMRNERTAALLEDAKRQRIHLSELSEKCIREKDVAMSERRRLQDEFRAAQQEIERAKERHADEVSQLRKDGDRFKVLLQDKERSFAVQLAEERRGKEALVARVQEIEEEEGRRRTSHETAMRSLQEEHRKQMEQLSHVLSETQESNRALEQSLVSQKSEVERRLERERSTAVRDVHDKLTKVRYERDEALDGARQQQVELERLRCEVDHYRSESEHSVEVVSQWQHAKDKAETQLQTMSATLALMLQSDERTTQDNSALHRELDQALAELAELRREVEHCASLQQQVSELTAETHRLTEECSRVTLERNDLVVENGRLAEELVKWRGEMREMMALQRNTAATAQQRLASGGRPSGPSRMVGRAITPRRFGS